LALEQLRSRGAAKAAVEGGATADVGSVADQDQLEAGAVLGDFALSALSGDEAQIERDGRATALERSRHVHGAGRVGRRLAFADDLLGTVGGDVTSARGGSTAGKENQHKHGAYCWESETHDRRMLAADTDDEPLPARGARRFPEHMLSRPPHEARTTRHKAGKRVPTKSPSTDPAPTA